MKVKLVVAALFGAVTFAGLGTNSVHAQSTAASPEPKIVVVAPGDSLSKIATAHQTTYNRLFDANAFIVDPNVIHPGQQVRVPAADEQLPSRPLPSAAPAPQPAAAVQQPKKPTAQAPKKSAPKKQAAALAAAPVAGDVWGRLAACESGGRANVNTGNGYYGAYQFSASTWRSVGGSGLPHQASLEEQTARAQALQQRSGWGQWPACSAKLGLR